MTTTNYLIGKVYEPILKQSSYKADLITSLENIKKQASRVKEEAEQCLQRRVMDMDQSLSNQNGILLETNQISTMSHQILLNLERRLFETSRITVLDQGMSKAFKADM